MQCGRTAADAVLRDEEAWSLVFAQLDGDVSALCASAGVSKRWRDVLTYRERSWELWSVLRVPGRLAPRLTDAQLASLVARARGKLKILDVSGCELLTAAGLKGALANQTHLVHFAAVGCYYLSSVGVARALTDRRLDTLLVRGVATGRQPSDGVQPASANAAANPAVQMVKCEVAQLQRRLKSIGSSHLDASAGCTVVQPADQFQGAETCGRLCGDDDRTCDCCPGEYRCIMHGSPVNMLPGTDDGIARCLRCEGRMCTTCAAFQPANADCATTCGYRHAWLCPNCIAAICSRPLPSCAGVGCVHESACDACLSKKSFPTVYVANATPGRVYYLCDSEECRRSHAQRRRLAERE